MASTLIRPHCQGLEVLRSAADDEGLDALEAVWTDMDPAARGALWDAARTKLTRDPAFAPLLKTEVGRCKLKLLMKAPSFRA